MNSAVLVPATLTLAASRQKAAAFRMRYQQPEVTLKLCHSSKSALKADQPVAQLIQAKTETEILFAQLLVESGITPLPDINTAIEVATLNNYSLLDVACIFFLLTPQMWQSLKDLVKQIHSRELTFDQAVVAARQVTSTGDSPMKEGTGKQPRYSRSIIEFLKDMSLICENDLARWSVDQSMEPTVLAGLLVATGVVDSRTLRSATRLRYLMNKGEIDFQRAKTILEACVSNNIEVEDYKD